MKRVICISGDAASGKTTAAKGLMSSLAGWRRKSTGETCREYCKERGLDPQRIPFLGDEFHLEVDRRMLRAIESESHLIAEGRLVGYLARSTPDALRVFCECPLDERARRHQTREAEDNRTISLEEAREEVSSRDRGDLDNLLHLYGIDYHDPKYYDLVLDTSVLGRQEVIAAILAAALAVEPPL